MLNRKLMSMSVALVVAQSGCASPEPQTELASAETERFEELYVETPDSVRLYVRILGSGPDTVLVGSAAYLAQDFAPLATGRTLIFYDPRSRGASDAVSDPARLGMDFEVRDIEAVRSHFRIG